MDYQYWNNYYSENKAPTKQSKFAEDIIPYIKQGKKLVELGCGNGRDSRFFSKHGLEVLAIDQSDSAIDYLEDIKCGNNITFKVDNFIESDLLEENKFDYVYSRFTMHSITEQEEDKVVKRSYACLKEGGMIFIEARSVKDNICGLGKEVARNTYEYNNHCRRFIVKEELEERIKKIGFKIKYINESDNCAVFKDENPVVVRLIAQK